MKKIDVAWRLFSGYLLVLLLILISSGAFGQIEAKHFNAGWNEANNVPWFMDLKDCKTIGHTDIAKNPDEAKKYKIAVVPTIIIFKDGEEVARFQADLSFKMVATREEVQEEIDNQLMSDF
tara:strand:+ start:1084 stop:1446 length:363 start_codon:yes stop_codon:yes gene_type:complete